MTGAGALKNKFGNMVLFTYLCLELKIDAMYKLICTSYNKIGDTLQLRHNWIEELKNDKQLSEYLDWHKLPTDFKYLRKGEMSDILVGEMDLPNVELHVRILRVGVLITTEDIEIQATNWEDCNPINAFKAGVKFANQ